jgi:twitching motility protein PilT
MSDINDLLQEMAKRGASDLHLHEGQPAKIRVVGDVKAMTDWPMSHDLVYSMLSEACGPDRWKLFLERGDLDYAYELDEHSRFRTNYMKHVHGVGAVFRLIPTKIMTLEQLGIPLVAKSFAQLRGGLVLLTGPTGTGKSTTLAALIDFINVNYARHIVTIEEPIEFVHSNKKSVITQREVSVDTPTYQSGLKAAMREDADMVLVGELRDLETISLALTASETGMLVFATLHTNNARKTVDRIIDAFPSDRQPLVRTMLANSLRGVLAQLLVKKTDGTGRLAVTEILVATSGVGAIIREGRTEKLTDVLIGGKGEGMRMMDDSIMEFLVQGAISPMEAYMKAIDKTKFEPFLPEDSGIAKSQ